MERAARNIDRAAMEAKRRDEAARATTERIKTLRRILFQDAPRGNSIIDALTNEPAAARLLIQAGRSADDLLVLGVLQLAIDNQWGDVVKAGTRHFEFNRTALLIQELWNLTTARAAV